MNSPGGGSSILPSVARGSSERTGHVNRYVSERLRDVRKERGLSQRRVAELLNDFSDAKWNIQTVSRAELCDGPYIKRWNVDDLFALASAFEVPVSYFLPYPLDAPPTSRSLRGLRLTHRFESPSPRRPG